MVNIVLLVSEIVICRRYGHFTSFELLVLFCDVWPKAQGSGDINHSAERIKSLTPGHHKTLKLDKASFCS